MKQSVNFLILFVMVACLSGCATVFTGTTQSINVEMRDEKTQEKIKTPIQCDVTDTEGTKYLFKANPGNILVRKGNGVLQVQCKHAGYEPFSGVIHEHFNAVSILDIFLWPTFFVDYATGAMMKYPGKFMGEMTPR